MILFTLYPVIYTVLGSLKTNAELTLGNHFLPEEWHFENYYKAFIEADFAQYTVNSVIVSVAVTLLAVVTCSLAGFILARKNFVGKKIILTLYTSMMFVSLGSVTLYPIYELLRAMKLNKTLFALVVALELAGKSAVNHFYLGA